jgi:hypothetical protein
VPLIVQVNDSSGQPIANVQVVFGRPGDPSCNYACPVFVRSSSDSVFRTGTWVNTGTNGHALVHVRFLYWARPAELPISVPTLGLSDSASFTVLPGAPAWIEVLPADTSLYAGGTSAIRIKVHDRGGNLTAAVPITYSTLDPSIARVSGAGVVTGVALGRARLRVASGRGMVDTVPVSVVPAGRLALGLYADNTRIDLADLDGSSFVQLASAGFVRGGHPSWKPDGTAVAFQAVQDGSGLEALFTSDLRGVRTQVIQQATSFEEADSPRFSRDGTWLYFRGFAFGSIYGEIWRVHPDGSGLERIGDPGNYYQGDLYPDPSPDGAEVLFTSYRQDRYYALVRRSLATGAETLVGVNGLAARWSPSGDWIAYWYASDIWTNAGAIYIVHPDGSGGRMISSAGMTWPNLGLTWSPDGEWVAARGETEIDLINVATGLTLPVSFTAAYSWPDWHP